MKLNVKLDFLLGLTGLIVSAFSPISYVPVDSGNCLFSIARSRDANEICYRPNIKSDGSLDENSPILIHWIKTSGQNRTEPLTWIQNKYAYGIEILDIETNPLTSLFFRFVSYNHQVFELRKTVTGDYRVYTQWNNQEIELTRIFVQIEGGTFWVPSIPFVKISGILSSSGTRITKTIYP